MSDDEYVEGYRRPRTGEEVEALAGNPKWAHLLKGMAEPRGSIQERDFDEEMRWRIKRIYWLVLLIWIVQVWTLAVVLLVMVK